MNWFSTQHKQPFLKTGLLVIAILVCSPLASQETHIGEGLADVAAIAGETKTVETPQDSISAAQDTAQAAMPAKEIPLWKQKLYYGYNFDIYFHNDTRDQVNENGWSLSLTPGLGWRLNEKWHLGLRFGGSYASSRVSFLVSEPDTTIRADLRVHIGSWEVTPYVRYKMKTLFNDKVGIWLEAHLYTGMAFPRVTEGNAAHTYYDGLRHEITYGFQVSPVITYQFSRKSTFQIFFSILSLGYSGTAFFYTDRREYTNDIIIFSGKLSNLLNNQFTPGLYGIKFGVQKSF